MNDNQFAKLLAFLERLEKAKIPKIAYSLKHSRPEGITVNIEAMVPGERWEIEFVDYGDEIQIEIERFRSTGEIKDECLLNDLFAKFSDEEPAVPQGQNAEK